MSNVTKGFTLIELIIAIVIIGILVTAASLNYEKARSKTRDNRRKADMANIAIALDSYYAFNKKYPGGGCDTDGTQRQFYYSTCSDPWIPNLEEYLNPLPKELGPQLGDSWIGDNGIEGSPCQYLKRNYNYLTDNTIEDPSDHYVLLARLELEDPEVFHQDKSCGDHYVNLGSGIKKININLKGFPIYAIYK